MDSQSRRWSLNLYVVLKFRDKVSLNLSTMLKFRDPSLNMFAMLKFSMKDSMTP